MGALGNVTGFWEGLTGPSRRLLIGAVVIFIVGIFMLMRFSGQDSYATLSTSTSAADASAITKQLDTLGIRYKLTDGGSTVQVPSSEVDKARIDLASSGRARRRRRGRQRDLRQVEPRRHRLHQPRQPGPRP